MLKPQENSKIGRITETLWTHKKGILKRSNVNIEYLLFLVHNTASFSLKKRW